MRFEQERGSTDLLPLCPGSQHGNKGRGNPQPARDLCRVLNELIRSVLQGEEAASEGGDVEAYIVNIDHRRRRRRQTAVMVMKEATGECA